MRLRLSVLGLALLTGVLGGCARGPTVPVAQRAAPLAPSGQAAGLRVMLTWSAPVDLDLYLTDPTSETVYFGNNPSRSGARLLRDARCGDFTGQETSAFELASIAAPTPGRYRVGVDFIDACDTKESSVSFRVLTQYGDTSRETDGTITLEDFQPVVVEFDLHPLDGSSTLVLSQEAP